MSRDMERYHRRWIDERAESHGLRAELDRHDRRAQVAATLLGALVTVLAAVGFVGALWMARGAR